MIQRTLSRRSTLALMTAAAATPAFARQRAPSEDWAALGADVKSEFKWAWGHYVEKAWGKDEINPVSGTSQSFFIEGHDLGLSLVEALDTLWIMELDDEFRAGVDWVKANLDFDIDGEAQVFETNIRLVGGLLSAHLACGDPVLLAKAKDLADRLMKAFDASPHGLPYRYVNLKTGAVRDPETNLAEIGTYATEFGLLGQLTGDDRYYAAAKRAMKHALDMRSPLGLMAANIHAETGKFTSRNASIDVYADSFYEYLWDSWEMFGDAEMKTAAQECMAAMVAHQGHRYDGKLWFPMVDYETGAVTSTSQTVLGAYLAGLLGQVGLKAAGDDFLATYTAMQEKYVIIPESTDVTTGTARSKRTGLRPEFADACLNLWLGDRDDRYRGLAAIHYRNMKTTSKAAFGYTSLKDITTRPMEQGDNCPGYWWSEQMKYYYLLFADAKRVDYGRLQLSTEANVLRGFRTA
ncbi:glycoside hydrolase family 47 protein [Brevundimonas goettingensis]|uniref:Glycoside hydrolase family 47 protein n=1 Tax=Brevundimonas goettingensis TaxID=2774190 RepID=A0A975C3U0_9CAUL|nr:glycoside hydrolase family 47 protein [Brevundimonas goettingensis]QTC92579.1 glycoside hydrolase family 47 protein [Brevundimonas goettingensis]